jgi:hypothetical protein
MNKRASILIITVWALSILSVFAISLSYVSRTQMRYAAHMQDRVKLYYLARAGIEKAVVELENKEDSAYMAFDHPILNNKELFKDMPLGDGFITLSYAVDEGMSKNETIIYGIMDESSRIDINNAPVSILANMLENAAGIEKEQAADMAQAMADWRSLNQSPEVKKYYEELKPPYENKGGKFQAAEELLLVRGMTQEAFLKIKDIVTVYDTEQVNINTAGFDVFYALGLNRRLSDRILEYRRGRDGITGTDDDNVFETVNDLRKIGFLFTEDSIQINSLISGNIIKTRSDIFRIISSGRFEDTQKTNSRNITCVLKLQAEQMPGILYWYEN